MSITNADIITNRIVAGTANIGTLNSGSMSIRSGSLKLSTLESNTLDVNNLYVAGDLCGATITGILNTQTDLLNDVSVNKFRIQDLSEGIHDNTIQILDLSNQVLTLNNTIASLDISAFIDLSGRVKVNRNDISDLSGRINDIIIGEGLVTQSEFGDLSQSVTSNANLLLELSGDVAILRTGFVTSTQLTDLSGRIQDNSRNIIDLCDGVSTLIGLIGGGGAIITNQEFIDLSSRVGGIETDLSNLLTLRGDVSDLSGRLELQDLRIDDLSNSFENLKQDTLDISNTLSFIRNSYIVNEDKLGLRVDPSNEEFIINFTLSDGTLDTSGVANIVIGLSSDNVVINGNTTFRGQVQFQDVVSVPPNTVLIDTSGVTTIDFLSNTPYSHTDYIMFDTSSLNALEYYGDSINPDSAELRLRFSRLSKSRNIFISCPPATLGRLTLELYDDDDLSDSTIVRMEGNILVQPGAVPIGFNGLLEDVSSSNADRLQDYSSDPYRYLYDICDNRGNMGRFFYTQAVVVPRDDVSNFVGTDHPNATGNRMDISFYPDVSNLEISGFGITERYHRYYQTGSYQFNIEYVSTGIPRFRNRAHLYVRETARIRPLRYAERTNSNVELSQSNEDTLQLLIARTLFLKNDGAEDMLAILMTALDFYANTGIVPAVLPGDGGTPPPP